MRTGLLAEYETPEALVAAAHRLREAARWRLDAYTPYPLMALEGAVGLKHSPIPRWVLGGAVVGIAVAWFVQWYPSSVDYPLNVSSFNPNSAPSYVFIGFELAVLFGGVTAFLAVFILSRLPRLWDPIDTVEGFDRATVDRFFLRVDGDADGLEDAEALLSETDPLRVVPLERRP